MTIEILYVPDCPNYRGILDRLKAVLLEEGLKAEISQVEVKDVASAKALNFTASPTIRINGIDIEPDSRTRSGPSLACRWYPGGLPGQDLIRTALRKARFAE